MKQWKEDDATTNKQGKHETLATRQQYFRYLNTNPIFTTLCDIYGGMDKALEELGFTGIFHEIPGRYDVPSPIPSGDTALNALKDVQMVVDRLDGLLK